MMKVYCHLVKSHWVEVYGYDSLNIWNTPAEVYDVSALRIMGNYETSYRFA
jgi:hypothetical protein